MDKEELEAFREEYSHREVFIVATDKQRLTMTGEDGVVYHQRPDHFWSSTDGDEEGAIRYQGSAFHGHGIRLKPFYVRKGGEWIHVFTGKKEVVA